MTVLTYFVELREERLCELFQRPGLLDRLAERPSTAISMAILDLSPGRAQTIHALNARGIPVTAWLVLDEAEGYWLTADNADHAHHRYHEVRRWAERERLRFDAMGLDIETPHEDSLALVRHGREAFARLLRRRRSRAALDDAARQYARLIDEIRGDGLRVESYQFPLVLDERQARSTFLQRIMGFVDVAPDREVLMLYRSLLPGPLGEALVDTYGPGAQAIGVGITGGGVDFVLDAVGLRTLDLERLITDLRRARRYTDQLYVFSLEGCVEEGHLDALSRADLERPVAPARLSGLARVARAALRAALRAEKLWDRLLDG